MVSLFKLQPEVKGVRKPDPIYEIDCRIF